MLDVARSRRPSRRSSTGRYYTHPPPPPPPPHPPTNVPTKGSAEKHEELPKVARTSVETSATDHTRCSEVTMIWKETRTRRGLQRPSEPPKKRKTDTDPPQRDIRWLGETPGLAGPMIWENCSTSLCGHYQHHFFGGVFRFLLSRSDSFPHEQWTMHV